jgi:UrcA family protein
MLKRLASAALAIVLTAALADTAAATTLARSPGAPLGYAPVKQQVIVSASGLNLSNPADADLFVQRLSRAINRACDDRPASGPALMVGRSAGFQSCRAGALEEASRVVHAPAVQMSMARLMNRSAVRLARR